MMENIYKGTHVALESESNFLVVWQRLSHEKQCQMPFANFRASKEHLASSRVGWLYRKGSNISSMVDEQIMWMTAFGLKDHVKDNGGIVANEAMGFECSNIIVSGEEEEKCQQDTETRGRKPLGLWHLRRAFYFLAIGLALAGLAFLAENNWSLATGRGRRHSLKQALLGTKRMY